MAKRSQDKQGVDRAWLIDRALDNLRWIHPDVKLTIASLDWSNGEVIKELERNYLMKEKVDGTKFKPVEVNE